MTLKWFICLPDLMKRNSGGAYQFLRTLAGWLETHGHLAPGPGVANVFLFSSFQYLPYVMGLRRKYPGAIFMHRVDGPMRLYNKPSDYRDVVVYRANSRLANGTVFQSNWSRDENIRLGMRLKHYYTVIPNAPDPGLFEPGTREPLNGRRKVRIMALSWSNNWNKGFSILKWLDEHLDFGRFDLTFMGNSPIAFNRIRHLAARPSAEVADELRRHDLFLAPSAKEPCSNALMEAMSCGLPVLALRDGSYPEMVGCAGEYFTKPEEIPQLLNQLVGQYDSYRSRIVVRPLGDIASAYVAFAEQIEQARRGGEYQIKKFGSSDLLWLRWTQFSWFVRDRIQARLQRGR